MDYLPNHSKFRRVAAGKLRVPKGSTTCRRIWIRLRKQLMVHIAGYEVRVTLVGRRRFERRPEGGFGGVAGGQSGGAGDAGGAVRVAICGGD